MRAYYATYNDKVYQLLGNDMVPSSIMSTPVHSHSEVSHMRDRRATNVKITISNVDSSAPSNKEFFEEIVAKLKNDKTTELKTLSNVYRIYTEYTLVDDVSKTVVDEGVGINEVKPDTFFFPLGITTENEFVTRLGISIESKIEKAYRDTRPFGVMQMKNDSRFILFIKRIYVLQLTMSAFSVAACPEATNPAPYMRAPESYTVSNYQPYNPPHWNCTTHNASNRYVADPCHPSIPTVSAAQTLNLKSDDYIVIYDTMESGLVFDPVAINYKPTSISIDIRFSFLDTLVAAQEDINTVLEENKKEAEAPVTPPVTDGAGSETETPSKGENAENSGESTNTPPTGNEGETTTSPDTETESSAPEESTTPAETETTEDANLSGESTGTVGE